MIKRMVSDIEVELCNDGDNVACTPLQGCHLREITPLYTIIFDNYNDMVKRFQYV